MIYHAFQVKMSAMNKPENSRKRKQFSIKDKIDIIDQVKNGKRSEGKQPELPQQKSVIFYSILSLGYASCPPSSKMASSLDISANK